MCDCRWTKDRLFKNHDVYHVSMKVEGWVVDV